MKNTSFQREFIRSQIPRLDRIFALQEAQKRKDQTDISGEK